MPQLGTSGIADQARKTVVIKVYLAARWEQAAFMRQWREALDALGIGCASNWLDVAATGLRAIEDDATMEANARLDFRDVHEADALILYSPKAGLGSGRGGRHVELGIALGMDKPVILVGERENVFHWHPTVTVLPEDATMRDVAAAVLAVIEPRLRR